MPKSALSVYQDFHSKVFSKNLIWVLASPAQDVVKKESEDRWGGIGANDVLKRTFTDLTGLKWDFRELKVRLSGSLYENWKFQFDLDFANVRQVKDIWVSYGKIPFLGTAKIGHMKEPYSLEGVASNANRTFMEIALPVEAFSPGRNIGIMCQNTALVRGPLSVQGELFQQFANAESVGDPGFWSFYVSGSYFLTGEHRPYDQSKGIFKDVIPTNAFHFGGRQRKG